MHKKCSYCGRRHRKHIKRCHNCGGERDNYHPCKKCGYMASNELKIKTLPANIMDTRHLIIKHRRSP